MHYYVHIHEEVKQAAKARGHSDRIETLKNTVELTSNISRFSTWLRPYLHEDIGGQFRLLIELHERNDSSLVVFRHLLPHEKYDQIRELATKDRQDAYNQNAMSEQEVEKYILDRQGSTNLERTHLPERDQIFLSIPPFKSDLLDSAIVLETQEWCESISSEEWISSDSRVLYKLIEQLQGRIEATILPAAERKVNYLDGQHVRILYRYFPQWSTLLLINALKIRRSRNTNEQETLCKKYGISFEEQEDLNQCAQRLYPALMIADYNIWWAIQSTDKANIVLSPEESRVLESLSLSDANKPRYPLFINGRAGSGKSTILQYLFAGTLAAYHKSHGDEPSGCTPLYITYTKPLLDLARNTVTEILHLSARRLQEQPLADTGPMDDLLPNIEMSNCFKTVGELMLELLPEYLQAKYKPTKCMTLSQFRKRWDTYRKPLPDKKVRELAAGIVWHGIRTYIKGLCIGSPRDYCDLPNDWKSISEEKFAIIFEHGWRWYNDMCKSEGFWDDQDLANELLRCDDAKLSLYPAIYCDEAQDFTSVELRLIQRLSRFSVNDFSNNPHLLKNIPFAFSGDPFQTLNPTGFKWETIKAMYHEYLIQRRGPRLDKKIELNYHELSTNYRSTREIIALSNTVQLIRCFLSREADAKPQLARDWSQSSAPQLFVLDEQVESQIRQSDGLVIIVPCDEDDEDDFRQRDAFLSSLVKEDSSRKARIMSPLRAKGLEWKRVLVYQFGKFAIDHRTDLCEFLRTPTQSQLDKMTEDEFLLSEYFLNQLYVAVTRPRARLIIVDSQDAVHNFWAVTNDNSRLKQLLTNRISQEWKLDHLGGFDEGSDESWDDEADSPKETAKQFEEQGIAEGDIRCLEDAQYFYRIAEDQEGQCRCAARVAELKDQFEEAAGIYRELQDWCSVLRSLWALGEWERMIKVKDVVSEGKTSQFSILLRAASIIVTRQAQQNELLQVLELMRAERSMLIEDRLVRIGIEKFFRQLLRFICGGDCLADHTSTDVPREIENALVSLYISDESIELVLAEVYFKFGDHQTALRIWTRHNAGRQPTPKEDPSWAVRAAVDSMPPAQRLQALAQFEDLDGVLGAWSQMVITGESVDAHAAVLVIAMAKRSGQLAAPFKALQNLGDPDRCIRVIAALGQNLDVDLKAEVSGHCIVSLVSSLVASRNWHRISVFCDNQSSARDPLTLVRQSWGWKRPARLRIATDLLARAKIGEATQVADRKAISTQIVKRYLWPGQGRKAGSKGGPPKLGVVVGWLGRVQILAALVEAVCSVDEACSFHRELLSALSARKTAKKEDTLFVRERLLSCACRLPNRPPWCAEYSSQWEIDVDGLSELILLPSLSEKYINDLFMGRSVAPVSVPPETPKPPKDEASDRRRSPSRSAVQVSSTLASAALVVRYGERTLDGEVVEVKERIVLRDRVSGDQVACGPDSVQSVDLSVDPPGEGPNSSWLIVEWNIRCQIEKRTDGTLIRFLSPDGVIAPAYVFPVAVDGVPLH